MIKNSISNLLLLHNKILKSGFVVVISMIVLAFGLQVVHWSYAGQPTKAMYKDDRKTRQAFFEDITKMLKGKEQLNQAEKNELVELIKRLNKSSNNVLPDLKIVKIPQDISAPLYDSKHNVELERNMNQINDKKIILFEYSNLSENGNSAEYRMDYIPADYIDTTIKREDNVIWFEYKDSSYLSGISFNIHEEATAHIVRDTIISNYYDAGAGALYAAAWLLFVSMLLIRIFRSELFPKLLSIVVLIQTVIIVMVTKSLNTLYVFLIGGTLKYSRHGFGVEELYTIIIIIMIFFIIISVLYEKFILKKKQYHLKEHL